jgi:hypothetical protein
LNAITKENVRTNQMDVGIVKGMGRMISLMIISERRRRK